MLFLKTQANLSFLLYWRVYVCDRSRLQLDSMHREAASVKWNIAGNKRDTCLYRIIMALPGYSALVSDTLRFVHRLIW